MAVSLPAINWTATLPLVFLLASAIVILVADAIAPRKESNVWLGLSLLGMLGALFWITARVKVGDSAFGGFLRYDSLGRWGAMIALMGGCLIAAVSPRTIKLYDLPSAEYFALLLFTVFGIVLLCISLELFTMFLAVEIIAAAIYIMTGLRRNNTRSAEAALKYFILAALSSAFLIFGFVFLYGGTQGNSMLGRVGTTLLGFTTPWAVGCIVLGLAFVIAAFSFKLSLAPFHLYAADVFEGAPTPVAALLATGSKLAGFVALVHILTPFHGNPGGAIRVLSSDLVKLLWLLSALSIIVGNTVALLQRNIKRMLAYSSIAHSGYLLIAVLVLVGGRIALAEIQEAMLVYLFAYVFMNVAAFGIALTLGKRGENDIDDYAGLAQRAPGLALAMALAMLSLTGMPATVGFVGKFYVFAKGIEAGFPVLVIIAVLGSVVSMFYYLRVIVFMYMHEPREEYAVSGLGMYHYIGLFLATVPLIGFGILPESLIKLVRIL